MVSDSEPGKFFGSTPANAPGIKIPTPSNPLGKCTENVENKK